MEENSCDEAEEGINDDNNDDNTDDNTDDNNDDNNDDFKEPEPSPRRKGRPVGKLQHCPHEDCSYSTTKKSQMFRHRTGIHDETLEKPVKVKKVKNTRIGRPPSVAQDCPHEECTYQTTRKPHMVRHRNQIHKENIEAPPKRPYNRTKPRPSKPPGEVKKRVRVRNKEQKFSCEICGAKAVSMWYINRHMRLHTGEKPFICPHPGCDYRSYRKYHLTRHELNIHSNLRPHQCEDCDYASKTRSALRQHVATQHSSERNEHCKYCDYAAKLPEVLRSHARNLHKNVCEPCSWEFADEKSLAEHLNRHQELGVMCQYCSFLAPEINALKSHSVDKHKIVLDTKILRKTRLQPVCDMCDYQFLSSAALTDHRKYHATDGSILCQVCHQRFVSMENLKAHSLMVHGFAIEAQQKKKRVGKPRTRSHCCSVCNYEFLSAALLGDHQERHRQDGSIVCSQCSHISLEMGELVNHCLLVHNIDLQASPQKRKNFFSCKVCKYLFPSMAKLDLHKTQHQQDGTIQCRECPALMADMKELQGHMMLMHNTTMEATEKAEPLPCPICDYTFTDKIALEIHQACHMPDGSVCCGICPYHTLNMDFLKIHLAELHQVILTKGPPQTPQRKKGKSNTLAELPNHDITDILYTGQAADYEVPFNTSSYIAPPSCAFDGSTPNTLNYDTRLQNPFATLTSANQLFGNINKTDINFRTADSSITITNSNSNFSFSNRGAAMVCGSNNGVDNNSPLSVDLAALIPGGLPPSASKAPVGKVVAKNKSNSSNDKESGKPAPRLKAFPGLFS